MAGARVAQEMGAIGYGPDRWASGPDSAWAYEVAVPLLHPDPSDDRIDNGISFRVGDEHMLIALHGEAALVTPFERRWRLDSAARITRIASRWVDGEPAAAERTIGSGCVRDVAISVSPRGDLVLRRSFERLVRVLVAPCETVAGALAADSSAVALLAGRGPLATHDAIAAPSSVDSPLVPWLFSAALALALLELVVRRGSAPMWSLPEDVGADAHAKEVA